LQGDSSAHAFVGEPGIGKTTLATALCQSARQLGFKVVWGRSWEAGAIQAYWPWRQILDGLPASGQSPAVERLRDLWGESDLADFSTTDPRVAQLQLFEAVAQAIRAAANEAPLVLVLDDLHAADRASIELLACVLRMRIARTGWIITWRDAESERANVRDLISAVARESNVCALRPLSAVDSAGLVTETLGAVDTALVDKLFQATSGNPLFLVEVLRSVELLGGAPALQALKDLPVTQGVQTIVRERTSRLPPPERALLEVASAIGRDVDARSVADASGEPLHDIREVFARLCTAGFLRDRGNDAWSFSHVLVRDALYRGLEAERRRAIHLRIAQALDGRVRLGEVGLSGARVHHALDALPLSSKSDLAHWAIEASGQARAQSAFDDAVALLERALREVAEDDRLQADVLVALGWAYGDAGRAGEMRDAFSRVLPLARRMGDAHLLARAVIGYGARYVFGDVRSDLLPLLDEAEAALGSERGGLHARLLARRAAAMTPAADSSRPLAMARAALAELGPETDDRTFIDVAIGAGAALGDHSDPVERIPLNTRLVDAARRESDQVLQLRGLARLATDHLEAGDMPRADAVLAEWRSLLKTLPHPGYTWMAPLFESMRGLIEGRFAQSRAAVEEAVAIASASKAENATRAIALHRHHLYLLEDDREALRENEPHLLRTLGGMPELSKVVHLSVLSRCGELERLRAELAAVSLELPCVQATLSLGLLGEAVAPLGATAHARAVRGRLAERASSNASWGIFGFFCGLPVPATLGLLASVEGDTAAAGPLFEAALARAASTGAKAHEVWVRYWYGSALNDAKQLERAGELADALKMTGFASRLRSKAGPSEVTPAFFTLQREADGWRINRGSRAFFVSDVRGMGMLAQLVARPGEEQHSLDLAGAGDSAGDLGDAGELLDDTARAAYQRRARELKERIEDLEERGDVDGAEHARTELEAIARELSRATGLGGRKRRAGVATERARSLVQRRIREAIRRIEQADPELGAHLEGAIRTGIFCSYLGLRGPPPNR
jgi:tetratricopeptide (TPR) repeat protein